MGNLIKADFYRMRKSKVFIVCNIIAFALSFLWPLAEMALLNFAQSVSKDPISPPDTHFQFAKMLAQPVGGLILVVLLLSVLSFSFADVAHGYIKNIAGHVQKKSYTVVSKFIVIMIHNIIVMLVSVLGVYFGNLVRMVMCGGSIDYLANLGTGFGIFGFKWLLFMSLSTITLFFSTALRSKTSAAIVSVMFGTGALSMFYMLIQNFLHFDLSDFMPDSLSSTLNFTTINALAINVVASSVIAIAVFLIVSMKIVDKRDVK